MANIYSRSLEGYNKKTIIKLFVIVFFIFVYLFSFTNAFAASYYVSSIDGNDTNCTGLSSTKYVSGTAQACPWQTLSKVSNKTFQPGDKILFKKGDTFQGTVNIISSGTPSNPITYSSYGSGEKPIISGFTTITDWVNEGNGTWSKVIEAESDDINMVLVDGVNTGMGRWPNKGTWNTYNTTKFIVSSVADYSGTVAGTIIITTNTTHNIETGQLVTLSNMSDLSKYNGNYIATYINSTQFYITKTYTINATGTVTNRNKITSNQLTGTPNWTGAEMVMRQIRWSLPRCLITNQVTNTLTFVRENDIWSETDGFGYFIQDHIKTLDIENEWYYDGSKFYIYGDPTGKTVQIPTKNILFNVDTPDNIVIDDLTFEGANQYGIWTRFVNPITIENSNFINMGMMGIFHTGNSVDSYLIIDDNNFETSNSNAIVLRGQGTIGWVKNNTIKDISLIHGMGRNIEANGNGDAIAVGGTRGSIVEYNTLSNIGHIGIAVGKNDNIVRYNYIENIGLTKYDAGGIYAWRTTNTTVNNNIIIGSNHVSEGVAGWPNLSLFGIYFDEFNDTASVYNNTVSEIENVGIRVITINNADINNNLSFNNKDFQLSFGVGEKKETTNKIVGLSDDAAAFLRGHF